MGVQRVTRGSKGYKGLQIVTMDYRGLQVVTECYKG